MQSETSKVEFEVQDLLQKLILASQEKNDDKIFNLKNNLIPLLHNLNLPTSSSELEQLKLEKDNLLQEAKNKANLMKYFIENLHETQFVLDVLLEES
ncbi:hypothetical protein HK099_003332 [Clydaea vesicula]|uniref:Uncharacterized protein n=1 Tax=Clydaea vesicula TaxID=447962 RepID=A0AAD5U782_9FUNG|nr:hypothetical protein HK099_003332 [Clydaea vesicula]KAJ3396010.1 hypothetical protein HDU92_004313 [Lobulomyces angularis]